MKAVLAVLLLLVGSTAVESQSVFLNSELQPFRINKMMVTDLPEFGNTRVTITGRTLYGEEVPLFSAEDINLPHVLDCFLYFDDSIQNVQVEVASAATDPVLFDYATNFNPYRVTVFPGVGRILPPLPGYRTTTTAEHLRAGDILVLQAAPDFVIHGRDVGELLERGIHVITARASLGVDQLPAPEKPDPLRASLLLLDSLDPASLVETLQRQRESFASFKKRYYDLIAGSDFYGIPAARNQTLRFEDARIEDIAASLERRYILDRVTPFYRLVLLGFYLPALILVALFKRSTALLLPLAVLFAGFVGLSCFVPIPDKSLQLQLNPTHLEGGRIEIVRKATDEKGTTPIAGLLPPSIVELRFVPTDFDPAMWRLTYGLIRSNAKQVPLTFFTDPSSVKFNQLPKIERRADGYVVRYVNPLRYWSLHEPD
jgi:hypothetical protein